jgi:hypothetical protein
MCKFRVIKDQEYSYIWNIQKKFLGIWYTTSKLVTAENMEEAIGKAKYKLTGKPEVSEAYDC